MKPNWLIYFEYKINTKRLREERRWWDVDSETENEEEIRCTLYVQEKRETQILLFFLVLQKADPDPSDSIKLTTQSMT